MHLLIVSDKLPKVRVTWLVQPTYIASNSSMYATLSPRSEVSVKTSRGILYILWAICVCFMTLLRGEETTDEIDWILSIKPRVGPLSNDRLEL